MALTTEEIQSQKKQLRNLLRHRRRSLTADQQQAAAQKLFAQIAGSHLFRDSNLIAFTLCRDGEIDTRPLMEAAHAAGKSCFLPVMSNNSGEDLLLFRQWAPGISLKRNDFGIPEPVGPECSPGALDLVLLPLVGFDASCNRLGMGKGYYDHTFAFLRDKACRKPVLLGLAHECQRVEKLEVASWDLPLDGIVTDQGWYSPE